MSYATREQFRAAFGRDNNAWKGVNDDPTLQRFLDSATGRMDSTMVEAGYAAPIDATAAGDQQAALEAYLASRCLDGACSEIGLGMSPPPDLVTASATRFESWTRRLLGRKHPVTGLRIPSGAAESLPGLSRVGSTIRTVVQFPIVTQTQADHPFVTVPSALKLTAGVWGLALADAEDHLARAILTRIRNSASFDVVYLNGSEVTIVDHALGDPGETFYLHQTIPGRFTDFATSGIVQPLLEVKDADTVVLRSGEWVNA